MLTIDQIRAARALLDWSQADLAKYADLSQTGIARIENGTNQPNTQTLQKIAAAFESADIEFLGQNGLRKRTDEVKTLQGREGFAAFMNDVYDVASKKGGEICLHNAKPENWYKWMGEDGYKIHAKRMVLLKDTINVKITTLIGNRSFIADSFAEYRWFPEEMFGEHSYYSYGHKLAFLSFTENDVWVRILENRQFSEGFRVLFNIAWNSVAIIPPKT